MAIALPPPGSRTDRLWFNPGMTTLRMIAALDADSAIGAGNRLPWHLPDDLRRFKALTLGQTVLMGRKTAESLGRALPKRRNLVLTRSGAAPFPGMEAVPDLDAARHAAGDGNLWVIGGGEVYALCLPLASAMHLTHVDTRTAGADAWFPAFRPEDWQVLSESRHPADEHHAHGFRFVDYVRVSPGQSPR